MQFQSDVLGSASRVMAGPTPTAYGTLETTPLAHLLVYALDRRLTGSVVIEVPRGAKSATYLQEGAPSKAKTHEPVVYLGDILVELGMIDDATRARTQQRAAAERRLHGQLLIAEGAIDEVSLKLALREQVSRQVVWLFELPSASAYGYYEGANFLERWGGAEGVRCRPLALLWRGIRQQCDMRQIEAVSERLTEQRIKLHQEAQINRFDFDSTDQTVIDVLRAKPQPLRELLTRDLAPEDRVKRLVYMLAITRNLETGVAGIEPLGLDDAASSSRIPVAEPFGRATLPEIDPRRARITSPRNPESMPSTERRVSPIPPTVGTESGAALVPPLSNATRSSAPSTASSPVLRPPKSPLPPRRSSAPSYGAVAPSNAPSRRPGVTSSVPPGTQRHSSPAGLNSEVAQMKGEIAERARATGISYYQVLGVSIDAPAAQIQTAFFQLAKKWHPDRLGPEFDDMRAEATKVFARMSEAHQVLSDSRQRQEYDKVLESGGGAADEQEKVQAVLRGTMAYQKAEILLKKNNFEAAEREARKAVEEDPDQADHVALLAWIRAQKPGADLEQLLRTLSDAVRKEPNNQRIRWYRGQLYKRVGKDTRAINDFRTIIELNPNHLDASREIRLYEMRKTSSRPPTPSKGIGRWFKK